VTTKTKAAKTLTKPVKINRGKQNLGPAWKPGVSGNPAGRPLGARNRFSEDVIHVIAADWAAGGAETVARVRQTDPSTYFRVVASILPKDVLVNVQRGDSAIGHADDDRNTKGD
jgi:hypothetical protein